MFVQIAEHNSGTPLTDLLQILIGELGRTTGMFLACFGDAKEKGGKGEKGKNR